MKVFTPFLLFVITIALLNNVSEASGTSDSKARVAGAEKTDDPTFSAEQDTNLPNDPYMSYILWPHLHFSGTFRADVSTVNNNPMNFDTDNFVPADQLPGRETGGWNPKGSGEWSVSGSVTHVCYADGHCVGDDEGDKDTEPIMGAQILEGGNKTSAKLVDLDSEAQLFSEIWGWRIRIGNLFSADYTPVPFQYIWTKMITVQGGDPTFGAAYQSVLSNISWKDDGKASPFIRQLQGAMGNDNIDSERLSIRFNVDMYQADSKESTFTMGRVTGTIGLLGRKSPPFFTHGRMMKAMASHFQDAPFYVDETRAKVFVDFGNSLPINQSGSMDTKMLDKLLVAMPLDTNPSLTCSDNLLWLGVVYNKFPNWYQSSAGVQVFPSMGSLSADELEKISKQPLVVAEASGTLPILNCKRIVMAEALDGIDIHPYNTWTFRKNPGERANATLIATKFGKPLPGARVELEPCNCENIFSGGPAVGQPPLPAPSPSMTDDNGIVTFDIDVKDPKNNRKFIDGQLYPFIYSVENQSKNCEKMCEMDTFGLLNSLVVILAWDNFTIKSEEPTWLDDVYPIFQQYANLYPVMTDNFVDLGNYYDVLNHRKAIMMSLMLPMSHPNHMPVTRDLSASKRKAIVEWLSKVRPPTGDPQDHYSVEHLREDLQIALQLEHATIPTYLTALASIKTSYNLEVQTVMKTIIIQEMMHMALVANILNAVGGKPSLYSKDFIAHYPSRLPGGVQPDLVVSIEKLSLGLIRNIFMKIEQPELELEHISSFQHTFSFVDRHRHKMNAGHCTKTEEGTTCHEGNVPLHMDVIDRQVDEDPSPCFTSSSGNKFNPDFRHRQLERVNQMMFKDDTDSNKKHRGSFPGDDTRIVKHHNTIGGFYNHILNALGNLTECGSNSSIFTGDPGKQVDVSQWSVHGHNITVHDYFTAVDAIREIVEQGEGSSPCNPVAWDTGRRKDLSHYFLFYSVAEQHEIQVVESDSPPANIDDDSVVDFTKICNGSYYFNGSKIPFDPEGVWPMVSNPRMSKYKPGSKAYMQAERFNKVYTKLLKSLEDVFNGRPDTLQDALGLMYSVDLHLRNLVRTPIEENGDPDVGPNAGPPFDFTP